MTTDRPYRAARSGEQAIVELGRCAGSQFDPAIVELFAEVMAEASSSPLPPKPRRTRISSPRTRAGASAHG